MKRFLILIFLLFLQAISFPQHRLSGNVIDSVTVHPIRNAEVKFDNFNAVTDSAGYFSFDSLNSGTYKLEVNAVGYPAFHETIVLNKNKSVQIKLREQTVRTEEITVEEKKPLIEFQADKKVFNVDQSLLTKGGNALDVLRKVPLVDVDINDNVTLRGSTNFKLLIDDKPPRFTNLKQLPAEMIKSVEIITNPPAKYEAEGVTGIINIVLKHHDIFGFTGNVFLNSSTRDRYSASLNLNMKRGKWGIFSNGSGGLWHFASDNNSSTNYENPVSSLSSIGHYGGNSKYFYGSAGIEYEITKTHTIGIDGNLNFFKFINTGNTQNTNLTSAGNATSYYANNSSYDGKSKTYALSLYYTGKLSKEGREVSGDITYTGTDNPYNSDQRIQNYDSNYYITGYPSRQLNTTALKSYNLNVQLDYTHPFNDKTRFETGYKGIFRANDNDYTYDTLDFNLRAMVRNYALTNRFKLTEQINAVYASLSSRIDRFGFKLGLRAEYTNSKGELVTSGEDFVKGYWSIFPSAGVSYKIGMMNELSLNYSRRITRPLIYRLNPFVNRYNSKYIYFGNPDLNPEFTDSYELSFLLFTKFVTLTPMAFLRVSHDVISNYSYIIDSNVTVSTYRNAARSNAYGLDLIIASNTLGWLNLNGTVSFYNTKFDGDVVSDYQAEQGFTWKADCRASVSLFDILKVELYYRYTGKKFNTNGYNLPMHSFDAGISTNFFDRKVYAAFRVSDIFNTMKWGGETNGIGFTSSYRSKYDTRIVSLNLSYNFGNTTEYYEKSKKTKQNQNESTDQKEENVR